MGGKQRHPFGVVFLSPLVKTKKTDRKEKKRQQTEVGFPLAPLKSTPRRGRHSHLKILFCLSIGRRYQQELVAEIQGAYGQQGAPRIERG